MVVKPQFRASGLDRDFRCHGSRRLSSLPGAQPLEDDNGSEVCALGQWGHYLVARWAMQKMRAFAPEGGLQRPESKRPRFNFLDKTALRFCCSELLLSTDADMALEVEVALSAEFARWVLTGHIDVLAINATATRAKAWDWKLGWNEVRAAEANNQVLAYIVLLFLAYETLKEVTFYLVQPRLRHTLGNKVTEVTVPRDKLPQILSWLNAKVEECLDSPLELETGGSQCRYCPAAALCPAIRKETEDMNMTLTEDEVARLDKSDNIEELFGLREVLNRLASIEDKVNKRLRHAIYKEGKKFRLPDGRLIRLKRKVHHYFFEQSGQALYDRLAEHFGEENAIRFFYTTPTEVKKFAETVWLNPDGTPMQKQSKNPAKTTVESEFQAKLGSIISAQTCDFIEVE